MATLQSIRSGQFASNVAAGASIVRSNPMGVANAYATAIKQSVSQNYRDLYYGNDATQDQALAANLFFFAPLALPGGEGAQLAGRASEINGVLDPIAQSMRTTAVLRTSAGDIVASGGRDLTNAQIAALRGGEIPATPMPGAHAEVTALMQAVNSGSTPQILGASRPICVQCQAFIQSQGGTMTSPFTAIWK